MPRPTYCTPLDVYRRFDPSVEQSDLDSNDQLNTDGDEERILAAIEEYQADFERQARVFREVSVGRGGRYIYKSAKGRGFPIHVYLDHMDVIPFDAGAGDVIERRTGRDSWVDITSEEGSSWTAEYKKGKLTLFELPGWGNLPVLRRHGDRFIRLSYRHGAPGGDQRSGGQTTLNATLSKNGTPGSLDVSNAARLPPNGGTLLVDGSEYVRVDSVDISNDTISIASRGLRGTSDDERASGETIHYCPMDVRKAIAAKTARELVLFEDYADQLIETGEGQPPTTKLDNWQQTYERAVGRYSDNYGYV